MQVSHVEEGAPRHTHDFPEDWKTHLSFPLSYLLRSHVILDGFCLP